MPNPGMTPQFLFFFFHMLYVVVYEWVWVVWWARDKERLGILGAFSIDNGQLIGK